VYRVVARNGDCAELIGLAIAWAFY
jgi:hypothetical protein